MKNVETTVQPLNVALFEDKSGKGTVWVAQCMDFDLVAQGATEQRAKANFVRSLQTYIYLSLQAGTTPATPQGKQKKASESRQSAKLMPDRVKISYSTLEPREVVNAW